MATDLITQERLKSLLTYDPDTGKFRWVARTSNAIKVGDLAGCADKHGYIVIRIDRVLYKAHRLAWLYTYGALPAKSLDHINQIPADNRITNLREADQHENNQNRRVQSSSRSGVTGVSWNKVHNLWQARIHERGKCVSLGYHKTKEAAIRARAAAERKIYPFRTRYADADL